MWSLFGVLNVATAAVSVEPNATLPASVDLSRLDRCQDSLDTGTLTATVSVSAGVVRSVTLDDTTLSDVNLQTCLLGEMFALSFPQELNASVTLPVTIKARPLIAPAQIGGIQRVVQQNAPQIQRCYEIALNTTPSLNGQLRLNMSIVEGVVEDVRFVEGSLNDTILQDCVARRVKSWVFDPDVSGPITLPFNLESPN